MEKPKAESPRSRAVWEDKHHRILKSAKYLFLALGYERATMKLVAQNADCSVGYLYKHFKGKKEILNELLMAYLDVHEETRRRVRDEEGLDGLDCLKRELDLMCHFMVDHRALIPIFTERASSQSDAVRERMEKHRREDIVLLDRARTTGEIPDMDPAILCAVLDGALWALFRDLATSQRREVFLSIPHTINQLIFEPLRRPRVSGTGKDLLEI